LIEGESGVTVDGNDASLVLQVAQGVEASLDHLTITHGSGGFGGGINNAGTLTVSHCTFSSNNATLNGAALFNSSSGTLSVSDSTFVANGSLERVFGGGLENDGTATVSNCTFASNSAFYGGGICNSGSLTASNCTLATNSAGQGGGIYSFDASRGPLLLENTIVAGNSTSSSAAGSDIHGPADSASRYNLIGVGDGLSGLSGGVNHNRVGTSASPIDPLLGPLGDQGGPTQTMALLAGSPALDTGDPNQAGTLDQRGVVRSGGVNLGAYQASAAAIIVVAPTTASAGVPFDVTVMVVDEFGQVAAGYTGRIFFSTSDPDPGVVLPSDYGFGVGDGGVVTFSAGVTLYSSGDQTLTVSDFQNHFTGSTTVTL
jgi:hypothetical protein